MAKIPGSKPAPAKPTATKSTAKAPTKPAGGMSIPPAIKAEVRKIVREEVAKATKPRG